LAAGGGVFAVGASGFFAAGGVAIATALAGLGAAGAAFGSAFFAAGASAFFTGFAGAGLASGFFPVSFFVAIAFPLRIPYALMNRQIFESFTAGGRVVRACSPASR
jgi:hypothetical protein